MSHPEGKADPITISEPKATQEPVRSSSQFVDMGDASFDAGTASDEGEPEETEEK